MTISSSSYSELFTSFQREAFRLETLDDYGRSGNVDAYRTYLAGGPKPDDYNSRWLSKVGAHTRAGRRMYRVHIVARPLSSYLRFEFGWGYLTNMTAGEEFFILDITDHPNPLPRVPDFWLFDTEVAAVMNYDGEGGFSGADVLPRDRASEFAAYRDTALSHAVPFTAWWAEYGE
ncbi:hypothetical protein B4N89_13335 [Embleya scabrispora]|uniref:DUF6879 domain-containing protein n=1 Tax=Embleya scabrispora TaxID=159449 RepID=A0A1T3NY63_9ACTN|nr:DUF6879 family protein [Embleya scabrispora]OPC81787.1 hypothetical protein B4N89_13335 [Embleya scabrispora]